MDKTLPSSSSLSVAATSLVRRGHPRREALQIALKIAVIAAALMVVLHILLAQASLLHFPSVAELLDSALIATIIACALSYGVAHSLHRKIAKVTEERDAFALLSTTDLLSGLPNRRAFEDRLAENPAPASLALIDIDLFKRVNDEFGHMVGDHVIRAVAERLRTSLDPDHFIARAGGEEFAVIAMGASLEARLATLKKLHAEVEREPVETVSGRLVITVSIGVAELDGVRSRGEVLSAADRALYAAKNAGRNQIIHESALPASDDATLVPSHEERRLYRATPVSQQKAG